MFWKLLVVIAATAIAFRRSGALRHPVVRAMLRPGPNRPRNPSPSQSQSPSPPPKTPWFQDRLFLALLVIVATAAATWVIFRMYLSLPTH